MFGISLGGFLLWIAMIYGVTAILWGIYATEQQKKYYPATSLLKYFLVFAVNIIFMPVCILVAIVRKQ